MRYQPLIVGAVTTVMLSLVVPVPAEADVCPPGGSGRPAPASANYDVPPSYPPGILGPAKLPTGKAAALLVGYNRFGTDPTLPENEFLANNFVLNGKDDKGNPIGDWKYPVNSGFAGEPEAYTLQPGEVVDRFGSPYGTFLANDRGTSFAARGLPPSSLNTPDGQPEANYHVYCVLKPLKIQKGSIAKAFGQPGGGVQYYLGNGRVTDLITGGTLRELAP
jgi:hypothetical protein